MTRLSLAALLLAPFALAQDADPAKLATHRIIAVTVYQSTALITREVTVPDGVGPIELTVNPLPPQTVQSSLYAEGDDGVRVLNTRFRSRAIKEDTREEVRKLEAQLKQLQLAAHRIQADMKVIDENQKLLGKLETFTAATMQHLTEKGVLNSASTIELAKFITTTRSDRAKELVALQEQLDANKEQSQFAQRELGDKSSGAVRSERDAIVVIDRTAGRGGKVRLNYLVDSVSWRPQYKLRAGKDREPVTLEYLAAIHQQTGEDWKDVQLALSTAEPMLSAAPPELATLEVTAVPVARGSQSAANPGSMGIQPPGQSFDYKALQQKAQAGRNSGAMLSNNLNWKDANATFNEAGATEQFGELVASREDILRDNRDRASSEGPSVTYRLKSKLSLPSRTDEQTLEVTRLSLASDFFLKAVPVLTQHVYRQASMVNTSEYVLLPGEATMYLGSDFVGRAQLPLVAIGKGFTVGFGVDPQVQVQRQLVNKGRTTTGGNQILSFDYQILINSYKTEPVKLQVWERIPKAEAQSVAVSLTSMKPDLSNDPLYQREEKTKNLLRWDVVVKPGQNGEKAATVDYTYKLELDRQLTIGAVATK